MPERERTIKRSDAGELLVRQEIDRAGPMSFDRFVDIALYHPDHGYYSKHGHIRGRSGDYFTSMQVSDLFPRIFVEIIKSMRETLGSEQFSLVELGSGGGEFLENVLKIMTADERKGLRVWAVERSRPARENLWRRLSRFPKCEAVASLDDIEWMGGLEGLVFSNEFWDALPFQRLIKRKGSWHEIRAGAKAGALADVEVPLDDESLLSAAGLDRLSIPDDVEVEARRNTRQVYADVAARLSRGWIVSVDYGHPASMIGHPTAPRGTWRCFSGHALNENPYERIGKQDITANVDFSQIAADGAAFDFDVQLFASQGVFLTHAGKTVIEAALKKPDNAEVVRAVQQLIHPDAMGERFWALVQARSVELPPILAGIPNRAARLTKV